MMMCSRYSRLTGLESSSFVEKKVEFGSGFECRWYAGVFFIKLFSMANFFSLFESTSINKIQCRKPFHVYFVSWTKWTEKHGYLVQAISQRVKEIVQRDFGPELCETVSYNSKRCIIICILWPSSKNKGYIHFFITFIVEQKNLHSQ